MSTTALKSDNDSSNLFPNNYEQLDVNYDDSSEALWLYMKGKPRPCFTPTLLGELKHLIKQLDLYPDEPHPVRYFIAASRVPGIYNLGGDLDKFSQCIYTGDKEALRDYAYACLDLVFACSRHFSRDITTIALVQGSALGGGFESALSCDVIVAEQNVKMGFPEVLFNLFPGMGAHAYLSRRVTPGLAGKIISSGRIYTATELQAMGIVDVLVPDGEGVAAVNDYIAQDKHRRIRQLEKHQAKWHSHPVTLEHLREVSDVWVDTALQLDERSLRIMERLVRAQSEKMDECDAQNRAA